MAKPDLPPVQVQLNAEGDMVEIWTPRWSGAKPDKTYCLQPFGRRLVDWAAFQCFLIPVQVEMENHGGPLD